MKLIEVKTNLACAECGANLLPQASVYIETRRDGDRTVEYLKYRRFVRCVTPGCPQFNVARDLPTVEI